MVLYLHMYVLFHNKDISLTVRTLEKSTFNAETNSRAVLILFSDKGSQIDIEKELKKVKYTNKISNAITNVYVDCFRL